MTDCQTAHTTELTTEQSTQYNRASSKFLTNNLLYHLVDIVDSPLIKSYWNTYHCSHNITILNGKVFVKYCKNRWCLTCSRNLSAKYINTYRPIIEAWLNGSYFLTLTAKTVTKEELPDAITERFKVFALIFKKLQMQAKRAGTILPEIILKLEITHNVEQDRFHPHFHAILNDLTTGKEIISEWIKHFKNRAELGLQDLKQCDENSVFELFKYVTKIFSSKDQNKTISIAGLDTIYTALKGKRTLRTYGFKLPNDDETTEPESADEILDSQSLKKLDEVSYFTWEQSIADWIDVSTGEVLTGHKPSQTVLKLISNIKAPKMTDEQLINDLCSIQSYNKQLHLLHI